MLKSKRYLNQIVEPKSFSKIAIKPHIFKLMEIQAQHLTQLLGILITDGNVTLSGQATNVALQKECQREREVLAEVVLGDLWDHGYLADYS